MKARVIAAASSREKLDLCLRRGASAAVNYDEENLRDRLRENDLANTQCILALGNMIEQSWASEWWEDFSKMKFGDVRQIAPGVLSATVLLMISGTRVSASPCQK